MSSNLESPHFLMYSAKCREGKIGKRNGHGKSRNGQGEIFCQVCGNPDSFVDRSQIDFLTFTVLEYVLKLVILWILLLEK